MNHEHHRDDAPFESEARLPAWIRMTLLCGLLMPFVACHSNNDAAPPPVLAAPTILSVTTDDGTAEVEWTLVPEASSYNLYWDEGTTLDPSSATQIRDLDRLRYRITGLVNGNTYCYAVSSNE